MNFSQFNYDALLKGGCIAFSLATVGLLLVYVGYFSKSDFGSDDAVLNVLAGAGYEQGRLIVPRGWVTANSDIIFPSAALMMRAMLPWLPNGFTVHAIAACALTIVLLIALAWGLVASGRSTLATTFVVTILATGLSQGVLLMTFTQTTYFWWPFEFLTSALIIQSYYRYTGTARKLSRPVLAGLLFAVNATIAMTNPMRVLIMVVVPLLVFNRFASAGSADVAQDSRASRILRAVGPWTTLEINLALAVSIGAVGYYWTLYSLAVLRPEHATFLRLANAAGWLEHLKIFAAGWFDYMGGTIDGYANNVLSAWVHVGYASLALALSAVPLLELRRWPAPMEPARRAMIAAFFASFLPVFTMYILFDPLAQNYLTTRYFSVSVIILIVLCGWRVHDWLNRGGRARLGLLLLATGCLALTTGYRLIPFEAGIPTPKSSSVMLLADALRREGLVWGYATYWNANSVSVLSDSLVRVSPIQLTTERLMPYPVMIEKRWYNPNEHVGQSFLALTDDDLDPKKRALLTMRLGSPVREFSVSAYHVMVYDRNISAAFDKPWKIPDSIEF